MKEATGELNMTVITIVAVAAIAAFFYLLIWPTISRSMALNTACNAAGKGSYKELVKNSSYVECANGKCTYYEDGKAVTEKDC